MGDDDDDDDGGGDDDDDDDDDGRVCGPVFGEDAEQVVHSVKIWKGSFLKDDGW